MIFFFKQKTAYEMRISDWSSDVCSSDLQKIFITFGEHDLTDNIVHLVLARTPDAPAGSRGISLFLVPKFRLKTDGSPGEFNDEIGRASCRERVCQYV